MKNFAEINFWDDQFYKILRKGKKPRKTVKVSSFKVIVVISLKSPRQGFKSNLLTKVDFLLEIVFQVTLIFIPLEVGYVVIIVGNFVYKGARQLISGHHKIMCDWFIFSEYFYD